MLDKQLSFSVDQKITFSTGAGFNVGINTDSPSSTLHVAGDIQIGNDSATCDANRAGAIRYNSGEIEFCNGTAWGAVSASGADNLGDHTATQNIVLGSNWISGDGGNEGIRIDADGEVGIGTGNPSADIEIEDDIASIVLDSHDDSTDVSASRLQFRRGTGTANLANNYTVGVLDFLSSDTSGTRRGAMMRVHLDDAAANDDVPMRFEFHAAADGDYLNETSHLNSPEMTISSAGVGVLTKDPSSTLHVAGDIQIGNDSATCDANRAGAIRYNSGDIEFCNGTAWNTLAAGSGADNLGDHTATQNIVLGSNWISGDGGNEGIRIDADGEVGIGTDSPSSTLHVVGASSIGDWGSFNTAAAYTQITGGSNYMYTDPNTILANNRLLLGTITATDIEFGTNSIRRMMIDGNNGYVGIGTTAPSSTLHVVGAGSIGNWGSFNTAAAYTQITGGSNYMYTDPNTILANNQLLLGTITATDIEFGTNSIRRMMIDGNNGYVGVSTTSPSATLHVAGDQRLDGNLIFSPLNNGVADKTSIELQGGGTMNLYADSVIAFYESDADSRGMRFDLNEAQMTIGSNAQQASSTLYVDGDIQVGSQSHACVAAKAGAIRYDSGDIEFCNGTTWASIGGSGADNLGNHVAGQNIQLGSYFLSGDGDDEGLKILSSGAATLDAENTGIYITSTNYNDYNDASDIKFIRGSVTNTVPTGYIVGDMQFAASDGNSYKEGALMRVYTESVTSDNTVPMRFEFHTTSTSLGNTGPAAIGQAELVIKGDGKVGVGISDPDSKLHVAGDIQIGNESAACVAAKAGAIRYNAGDIEFCNGTAWASVGGSGADNLGDHTATQNIVLGSNYLSGDGGNEGIRIDADGEVGIGTDAPSATLHVKGTAYPDSFIFVEGSTGNDTGMRFYEGSTLAAHYYHDASGSAMRLNAAGDTEISFGVSNTEVVRIDTDGHIGIGTSAPASRLHVNHATSTSGIAIEGDESAGPTLNFITLGNDQTDLGNAATLGWHMTARGNAYATNPEQQNDWMLWYWDGSIYRNSMVVDSVTGNIGMGTTQPSSTLHVDGNTNDVVAQFESNDANSFISFYDNATSGEVHVRMGAIGDEMAFFTDTNERMRIDSAGNVGIGTDSPSSSLHVAGDIQIGNDSATCDGDRAGAMRYNGGSIELCNGTAWGSVGGGDNLGDHVVSQTLVLGSNYINGDSDSGEGLRVDSSGRIRMRCLSAGECGMTLNNTAASAGSSSRILFESASSIDVAEIRTRYNGSSGSGHGADLVFETSSRSGGGVSERMRIDEDGNVGIGTDDPYGLLNVADDTDPIMVLTDSDAAAGEEHGYVSFRDGLLKFGTIDSGDVGSNAMVLDNNDNVGIGTLSPSSTLHVVGDADVTGDVTANAFIHSSDRRLKDEIRTVMNPLEIIKKLRGVFYKWKDSGKDSAGVIAQEVREVLPSAVVEKADGMLAVEYDQLMAPMIEAIKMQQDQIEELTEKNEAQDQLIQDLISRVEALEQK